MAMFPPRKIPLDEEALYVPVQTFLEQRFQDRLKPAFGDLRHLSAITARAGGSNTGIWSKPDLGLAALWRYKYSLAWQFDVHGFEVKPADRCDLTAVHEALNHTSQVHYSHLVWHAPDWDELEVGCRSLRDRCERHGIGLITFTDHCNVDSFTIRVSGRRHEPAGDAVDEFLETRFSMDQKQQLLAWIAELR
jgi:hypothetical protein